MSRYDKYDPYSGGFRARLAAAWPRADAIDAKPYAVGLDATGRVVKGAGVTGIKGILILKQNSDLLGDHFRAGTVVDIMTAGDIVEWATTAGVAGVAGTNYYGVTGTGVIVAGTGAGGTTQPATSVPLGYTVEAGRLVCRVPGLITASA